MIVVVAVVVVAVVVVAVGFSLSIWKRSYSARLPQFLNLTTSKTQQFCETSSIVCTWQHQKRSNSARLPQFSNLTTSKTKQFCVTSSIFELNNVKNEVILRDFFIFQTWQHQKRSNSDGLVPMRFAIFPLHLSKVLRLPRKKVMPGHMKCCTCHAKSSQQTWKSDAPKCNHSQEISALTSEQLRWKCLLYCACHGKCIFADPLQMSHSCHPFWKCYKTLTFCSLLTRCTIIPFACHAKRHLNVQKCSVPPQFFLRFWLGNVLRATTPCTFSTSQLLKVLRTWCALYILTSKCASRHNGVHFFDISTAKSGPDLVCFVHFDFEMCFAPQRRAIVHLSSGQMAPHPPL